MSGDPVPGIDVIPLSNDVDLTELGDAVTTDDDGSFTFKGLEDGLMCVRVMATKGDAAMVDTFSCNIETDQQDIEVSSLPLSIAQLITTDLYPDADPDPTLTSVSGGVYYLTEDGLEIPVDCATLEVEEATEDTDILYMEGVMPVRDATQTDSVGRFLITRLPAGQTTINAFVDGEKIGSVSVPLPAPAGYGVTLVSNVTKIIADEIGDPSPGTCE